MNRYLAFFLALVFASISVSSACVAAPSAWIDFSLKTERGSYQIRANFHNEQCGNCHLSHVWAGQGDGVR